MDIRFEGGMTADPSKFSVFVSSEVKLKGNEQQTRSDQPAEDVTTFSQNHTFRPETKVINDHF